MGTGGKKRGITEKKNGNIQDRSGQLDCHYSKCP